MPDTNAIPNPLEKLDDWDDFVKSRYQKDRAEEQYRDHTMDAHPTVVEFYRQNHRNQTVDFTVSKEKQYGALDREKKSIWEAMEFLNTLVDDSDPDTDVPQLEHLLQTSEAIRRDGHPRWFVLAGLVHDLGKVLCLYGEPQWAVVGDTFPVGCAWSEDIVFRPFFADNPDSKVPGYQTHYGIYEPGCGFDNVHLSWGHDEYIYRVMKPYLPLEALYMLRYHSFYPAHQHDAYGYLMNSQDRTMFEWVKKFSAYDLYSKGAERPDVEAVKPYYEDLIAEFLPAELAW